MNRNLIFRNYRKTDIDAMFRLDEVCFAAEFRFTRRSMRIFAEEQGAISIVAENLTCELAGFVIVHVERVPLGLRGYVVTLDVAVKHRREGLAAQLLLAAEARVLATGAQWMELHVFTENEGAIRFYERMGYQRLVLQHGFYGASGLDAFIYRKELTLTT